MSEALLLSTLEMHGISNETTDEVRKLVTQFLIQRNALISWP